MTPKIKTLQDLLAANAAYAAQRKQAEASATPENETPAKQPKRRKRMVVEEAEPGFGSEPEQQAEQPEEKPEGQEE